MNKIDNFYFWLGADGELSDLENETTFAQRVEEDAVGRNAWLNVVEDVEPGRVDRVGSENTNEGWND